MTSEEVLLGHLEERTPRLTSGLDVVRSGCFSTLIRKISSLCDLAVSLLPSLRKKQARTRVGVYSADHLLERVGVADDGLAPMPPVEDHLLHSMVDDDPRERLPRCRVGYAPILAAHGVQGIPEARHARIDKP